MTKKPLTKAMRLVLERMEKGGILHYIEEDYYQWQDRGNILTTEEIVTFQKLSGEEFIYAPLYFVPDGAEIYTRTPAGRRALKEE